MILYTIDLDTDYIHHLTLVQMIRKLSIKWHFGILLISTSVLFAQACAYTSVDEKGRTVIHNFGYVKLVKPPIYPNKSEINVTGVELIGFSVGEGFTLGYKSNEIIQVPLDCRVLIIVENSEQFEHLLKEFKIIKGDNICATISPK